MHSQLPLPPHSTFHRYICFQCNIAMRKYISYWMIAWFGIVLTSETFQFSFLEDLLRCRFKGKTQLHTILFIFSFFSCNFCSHIEESMMTMVDDLVHFTAAFLPSIVSSSHTQFSLYSGLDWCLSHIRVDQVSSFLSFLFFRLKVQSERRWEWIENREKEEEKDDLCILRNSNQLWNM